MNTDRPHPIDAWREVSAQAAQASGYRSRPGATARPLGVSAGLLAIAFIVVVSALILRSGPPATSSSSSAPSPSNGPVSDRADDGVFRLELSAPHGAYGPTQPIEPVATLMYLGPAASVTIFHATRPIQFAIHEIDGPRVMGGGSRLPCLSTQLTRGEPISEPFQKAGSPSDDPSAGFDQAWYEDPVLRLPAGRWRIVASIGISVGDCAGDRHDLSLAIDVTVTGQTGPSASPDTSPSPSATISADAVAARQIAQKYVDALETDHPEHAWPLLSAWSRTAIGSSATFIDAERRSAAVMPGPAEVGIPSQDPDLLDPAFLGDRASDIKLVADASRTFVVSVRHPGSDGAAAGTETLVVAPVDGTWRIWPDIGARGYRWAYPGGCAAFGLSTRRCEAVIDAAASQASIDRTKASAIWLLPEPGCGGDPLSNTMYLCARTTSFVAGIGFESSDGTIVRADIFCGVGPPSLVCSDKPGIQAVDLHGGYWDVPCAGEAPAGCPSPLPSLSPKQAAAGTALRIKAVDVPVGPVGHREVDIGGAVLVDGLVQEARFSLGDQVQDGFALDPGLVRMELRSTIAGRPPFDNAYIRGTFDGLEPVRVVLVFDVTETSPGAVIHVKDVEVR